MKDLILPKQPPMNTENIIKVLNFLIFTQGLIFGVKFLFVKKKQRSNFFLGLFLVIISITHIPSLLLTFYAENSNSKKVLIDILLLTPALFYLYLRTLLQLKKEIKHYLLLTPGIIGVIVFFLTILYDKEVNFYESDFYKICFLLEIIFNVFLGIIIVKLLYQKFKGMINKGRLSEKEFHKYILQISILSFIIISHPIFLKLSGKQLYYELITNVFIIGLMYWLVFQCLNPKGMLLLFLEEDKESIINNKAIKTKKPVGRKISEEDFNRIDIFLRSNKVFKNPELGISDVAKATGMPVKKVSQLINIKTGKTFKTYINAIRVQKAVIYIEDVSYEHYTMEAIGNEVGYKSKATFYRAFKREMNCTPKEYMSPDNYKK